MGISRWSSARRIVVEALLAAVVVVVLGGGFAARAEVGTGERPVAVTVTPTRVLDTRAAPFGPIGVAAAAPLGARSQIELTLAGVDPVPPDAVGVILNVTALDSTAESFVTVWPQGQARPGASTLNPQPGLTVFNSAVIDLSAAGSIAIYNENGSTELIVDVTGYTVDHHHDDRYATQGHDHDDRYAAKITVVSTMVSTTLNPGNAIGVQIPCPDGTVAIAGGIDYFPAAVRRLDGYPTAPPDTVLGPMWVEQLYNDSAAPQEVGATGYATCVGE